MNNIHTSVGINDGEFNESKINKSINYNKNYIKKQKNKKRKTYHRIEFSGGRIYWADSVHVVSQREVSFVDVYSKRNVRIYGHFTISSPKK